MNLWNVEVVINYFVNIVKINKRNKRLRLLNRLKRRMNMQSMIMTTLNKDGKIKSHKKE
jgi:hypothetical protein